MRSPLQVRFMVDHMLVKLGIYLRILGYAAAWEASLRTHELIHRANAEDRVFLTRNTRWDQYPVPQRGLVIASTEPVAQLQQVAAAFALDMASGVFTRCIRCNVQLALVADKPSIKARVHPNVYARQDTFYTCPRCGTVFWKGSHVASTVQKLGLIASHG